MRCRADMLLFMTTANHPELNTVELKISIPESRVAVWEKTKCALM